MVHRRIHGHMDRKWSHVPDPNRSHSDYFDQHYLAIEAIENHLRWNQVRSAAYQVDWASQLATMTPPFRFYVL
jgi:hypothetical protein